MIKNQHNSLLKTFMGSYKKEIGFLLCFAVFFIAGQVLFFLIRPHTEHFLVNVLNVNASSLIINTLTPIEKTTTEGTQIRSGNFSIAIEKGCEGVEGIILFLAALFAFYVGRREKLIVLIGALAGIAAIYFFNLLRIISLYYIFKYQPDLFDVMHIFVGQTVIIFISTLLFLTCINLSPEKN